MGSVKAVLYLWHRKHWVQDCGNSSALAMELPQSCTHCFNASFLHQTGSIRPPQSHRYPHRESIKSTRIVHDLNIYSRYPSTPSTHYHTMYTISYNTIKTPQRGATIFLSLKCRIIFSHKNIFGFSSISSHRESTSRWKLSSWRAGTSSSCASSFRSNTLD